MIEVHNDATADLKQIAAVDSVAFNALIAFIQQLKIDPALGGKLLDHGYGQDGCAVMSVMKWHSIHNHERQPVWRVKVLDLEKQGLRYRIIYFYYWRDKTYYIMAVVPRQEIDYDDREQPLRQRVLRRIRTEFPGG